MDVVKALEILTDEVRGLRADMRSNNVDTYGPKEVLEILGLNNPGYLTYYTSRGDLVRRKGGKSFVYTKESVKALAHRLNSGAEVPPAARTLYRK